MTRMIERWFPCADVSKASAAGWGTGNSEASLFPWFAKRPLAQAKAAVVTSLLPWPDDPAEQQRLQELVKRSLVGEATTSQRLTASKPAGYDEAHAELVAELKAHYPEGAKVLDPFSGRAMIPAEAARLGVMAHGIDYSPVATLAGTLLASSPLKDWSEEAPLPLPDYVANPTRDRLVHDVEYVLAEVERRYRKAMAEFYPAYRGVQPWGYLWAITLPCQECRNRFPLTGSLLLRHPLPRKGDLGQSYRIETDPTTGRFRIETHDGPPTGQPTRVVAQGKSRFDSEGKVAVCPFCGHVHPKDVHTRLMASGEGRDVPLLAADSDVGGVKRFRQLHETELAAIAAAGNALQTEAAFAAGIPAVPHESIPPGNTWTIQATVYGARTYGDLCNVRQTLGLVRLSRAINDLGTDLLKGGTSPEFAATLCGYAASVLARKLRRSTRGCQLQPCLDRRSDSNYVKVSDVFGLSESSLGFSYDYFEVGLGDGAGSWRTIAEDTLVALRRQSTRRPGVAAAITQGTATSLPWRAKALDAVVTDPPYDSMIDYTDASDLFYVWIKRSLTSTRPDFAITGNPSGLQEKGDEIIVKKGGGAPGEHRTQAHYDRLIAAAFTEARRVVRDDGVVTIIFGHGDVDVWRRFLEAVTNAGLVLTGSWPARTEKGGQAGSANIQTTVTMACRPASPGRDPGRVNEVDAEVRRAVRERVPLWEAAGLALTDQLMASVGPAMEVVGRYSSVRDRIGRTVDLGRYLPLARRAVEEAAAIQVEGLPLEAFDPRTRFALFWTRLYGRALAAKSEARWQALASEMTLADLAGVLVSGDKGVRLARSGEGVSEIDGTSPVIDVAFALARAWPEGLSAAGEVLASAAREPSDGYLWAALAYLSSRLPEGDPDRMAWTALARARTGVAVAVRDVTAARTRGEREADARGRQGTLFGERRRP